MNITEKFQYDSSLDAVSRVIQTVRQVSSPNTNSRPANLALKIYFHC